jgi:hypothetical protein
MRGEYHPCSRQPSCTAGGLCSSAHVCGKNRVAWSAGPSSGHDSWNGTSLSRRPGLDLPGRYAMALADLVQPSSTADGRSSRARTCPPWQASRQTYDTDGRGGGRERAAHYLTVYGWPRPAETLVRTAVSARFMVRMSSPVSFWPGLHAQAGLLKRWQSSAYGLILGRTARWRAHTVPP